MTSQALRRLLTLTVIAAAASLVVAAAQSPMPAISALAASASAAWLLWLARVAPASSSAPTWLALAALVSAAVSAAGGSLFSWAFVGCLLSLWNRDASLLLVRVMTAPSVAHERALIGLHLKQSGAVLGLSLLLALTGQALRPLEFQFDRSVLLALALLWGLARLARRHRPEHSRPPES